MSCNDIVQQAASRNFDPPLNIVLPTDPAYDASRAICNSRFDLKPCAIAYCVNEDHVAFCLQYCSANAKPFRVRAGGHQHEGMCSGDDVLMIDISRMNGLIEFQPGNQALIPAGKQLGDGTMADTVYYEVGKRGMVFPGGGCESVHIGGLLQGGGWGASSRMYGLTCDSLIEATVVLASGQTIKARSDNENYDLFWALKGGGGGNFGIVTKYLVQLYPVTERWLFTISWARPNINRVAQLWASVFSGSYTGYAAKFYPGLPSHEIVANINSGLRLNVVADDTKEAAVLNGLFYGSRADLDLLLAPFQAITPLISNNIRQPAVVTAKEKDVKGALDPHVELGRSMQPTVDAPTETCDGKPHPHKISSCFPMTGMDWSLLTDKITGFLAASAYSSEVSQYINLMSMQGKIEQIPWAGTAFPYRTKPFMMQMQAWWVEPSNPLSGIFVAWIADFREALVLKDQGMLIPLIEGAFINFPDKDMDQSLDISTPSGKMQLLSYYYGANLPVLRDVKTKYDPRDLFSFGMSIPPWNAVKSTAAVLNGTGASTQGVYMTNLAGVISYNTCRNGSWQFANSAPLPMNGPFPVANQFSTFISQSGSQYILIVDLNGKLWQINWPYSADSATLTNLDSIFYSSPDKLNYHLWNAAVAIAPGSQLMVYMITAAGAFWAMNYFQNNWLGAFAPPTNLPSGLTAVSCCSDLAGYYYHILVLDSAGLLWHVNIQNGNNVGWQPYNFTGVLDAMLKSFPGGLPVKSIKSASCSSDSQNTAHIVVLDTVQWDLWYIQHQWKGPWNYNFVNVQNMILANNPGFQRIAGFESVTASYDTVYNTLHLYATDLKNVIRHASRSANGAWSVFDIVPN